MNKARRHELKMLKYKKRKFVLGLKDQPLNNSKNNNYAFRSHGSPCSCGVCRDVKYREKRSKNKFRL